MNLEQPPAQKRRWVQRFPLVDCSQTLNPHREQLGGKEWGHSALWTRAISGETCHTLQPAVQAVSLL